MNLFVGGAALFLLGAVLGGRLEHWSVLSVLDLLALAFICGAGYIVWALLMKNNPVSRIAIFGFVKDVYKRQVLRFSSSPTSATTPSAP